MGACFFISISLSFFLKQIVLSFDLVLLNENAKAWHCQNIKQCRRVKGKKTLNQPYSHNLNQPRLIFRWHAFFQRNAFLVNMCVYLYIQEHRYTIYLTLCSENHLSRQYYIFLYTISHYIMLLF